MNERPVRRHGRLKLFVKIGLLWLVVCGASTAILLWAEEAAFWLLGVLFGLYTIGALWIRPGRVRWWDLALIVAWSVAWTPVFGQMIDGASELDDWMVARGWLGAPGGFFGRLGWHIAISVTLSGVVTAGVLWWVTRSWIVALVALLASLSLGVATGFWDVSFPIFGWHPVIAGTLFIWAIRRRLTPPPKWVCKVCFYDLRGLGEESNRCPECGAEVKSGTARGGNPE